MATPIGADTVTSISRRYIFPEITDIVYRKIPVLFRLISANKRMVQGGTQIEWPLMYQEFSAGGSFRGFDQLTIVPSDTIKNAALDWKQYYVPVAVDTLTLIKVDSPDAIANFLRVQHDQANMQMLENLADGVWSDGTGNGSKDMDGLKIAVDDGGVAATYAGINRSTNTWFQSVDDSTTSALTTTALQNTFSSATEGGRSPTLIASRKEQYNRYWALGILNQDFPVMAGGHDEQLLSAGFTNLLFNNVPWIQDSHVFDGPNASNSAIVMLCEDYIDLVVSSKGDFYMNDFTKPADQSAYVTTIEWAGNLVVRNPARQAKMTNISS